MQAAKTAETENQELNRVLIKQKLYIYVTEMVVQKQRNDAQYSRKFQCSKCQSHRQRNN